MQLLCSWAACWAPVTNDDQVWGPNWSLFVCFVWPEDARLASGRLLGCGNSVRQTVCGRLSAGDCVPQTVCGARVAGCNSQTKARKDRA